MKHTVRLRHVLNLLVETPDRSVRSISIEAKASRRTVARHRGVLQAALAKAGSGKDSSDVLASVLTAHKTWRARARPDFAAVDEALDRGESLRGAYRNYRSCEGKKSLGFAQFARLCREQRGGRSLKCVRRSHTAGNPVATRPTRTADMPQRVGFVLPTRGNSQEGHA